MADDDLSKYEAPAEDELAKYAQAQPQLSTQQQAAQRLTGGAISPTGLQPTPPLKPAMEAAGARHMQNEERLGQYEDFAKHSPIPFSNASLLYPAVELPEILRGASNLITKPFSRLSLADEWKVPGTPIRVEINAPPQVDRFGNEINIPGIESEMQTDIAKGQLQRAGARDAMYNSLAKAQAPAKIAGPAPPMISGTPTNAIAAPAAQLPAPSAADITSTGAQPTFVREIPRGAIQTPTIAGPEGEGPIGSNPVERRIQTTASKAIVTPEEYAQSVRDLGSRARILAGEGQAEWRARVTGLLKAARARTK